MAESDVPDAQWPVILDKKCELCEVNTITFKCLNCQEMICDNCKTAHLKSKVSKNHKVVCLISAEIYQSNETQAKCPTHTNEDLLMFCESCQVPICRDCIASSSHHKHQMVKIENVIDKKLTQLSVLIKQSKEKSSKYGDVAKSVDKNQQDYSMSITQKINEVEARKTELKNKLDQIKQDYVVQLQNSDKENMKRMTDLKQRVEEERSGLNFLIQQCEGKQINRNAEMVQYVTDVTQKLDQYRPCDPPAPVSPPNLTTRQVGDQEIKELFGILDMKSIPATISQPLTLKRNNKPSPISEVKIVNRFRSYNTYVKVTTSNDQAWLWKFGCRNMSLVTSDGKCIQRINTDLNVYDAALTTSGDLLVTMSADFVNKVKMLTKHRSFTDIYTATDGYVTRGITVTDTGNVLVVLFKSFKDSKIVEITTSGQHIATIQQDTWDGKLLFDNPRFICTNINGDIVVQDDESKVVAVTKSETIRFIYDGKERKMKSLFNPQYTVTDKYGQIMITDFANSAIHMLDQNGNFIQYLLTQDHGCQNPEGMDIDNFGRLWVCNGWNGTILIVKYI